MCAGGEAGGRGGWMEGRGEGHGSPGPPGCCHPC